MVINFQAAFAESAPPATAPLLELGKIEEWDGTKLKKRESEIRELVKVQDSVESPSVIGFEKIEPQIVGLIRKS